MVSAKGDNQCTDKKMLDKNTSSNKNIKSNKNSITFTVRLLDDTQDPLKIQLSKTDNADLLFSSVCTKLGLTLEKDYFGLRYIDKDKQRQWLELDKPAYKQLKASSGFCLSFRVKHYPMDPLTDFKQEITRYFLYLQIRRDLVQGRLLCPMRDLKILGALVVQSEYGDAIDEEKDDNEKASTSKKLQNGVHNNESDSETSISFENGITEKEKESVKEESVKEFMQRVRIIFHQTPCAVTEIIASHKVLNGLTAKEAETELLTRAARLPTYGIDPFQVVPLNKVALSMISLPSATLSPDPNSFTEGNTPGPVDNSKISTTPVNSPSTSVNSRTPSKPKETSYYIGITHAGVVTFVGLQRSQLFCWKEIQRIGCDKKRFFLFVFMDDNPKHVQELVFKCEKKSSALALWKWCVDRKYFFTLKQASQAKKVKPIKRLFSRAPSYQFSGMSQLELWDKNSTLETLPEPKFERVSSMRWKTSRRPGIPLSISDHTKLNAYSTFPRVRPAETGSPEEFLENQQGEGTLNTSVGNDFTRRRPLDSNCTSDGIMYDKPNDISQEEVLAGNSSDEDVIGKMRTKEANEVVNKLNQASVMIDNNLDEPASPSMIIPKKTSISAVEQSAVEVRGDVSGSPKRDIFGIGEQLLKPNNDNAGEKKQLKATKTPEQPESTLITRTIDDFNNAVEPYLADNGERPNTAGMAEANIAPVKATTVESHHTSSTKHKIPNGNLTVTKTKTSKTKLSNGDAKHHGESKPCTIEEDNSKFWEYVQEALLMVFMIALFVLMLVVLETHPRDANGYIVPISDKAGNEVLSVTESITLAMRKQPIVGIFDYYCYAPFRNVFVNFINMVTGK